MLYVNPIESNPLMRGQQALKQDQRQEVALKEFERVFMYQMLQEIRKTIPDNGLFPKGPEHRLYDEMMDDFMAGQIVESGQLGIAKQMAEQLNRVSNIPPGDASRRYKEGLRIVPDATGYSIRQRPIPLHRDSTSKTGLNLNRAKGLQI